MAHCCVLFLFETFVTELIQPGTLKVHTCVVGVKCSLLSDFYRTYSLSINLNPMTTFRIVFWLLTRDTWRSLELRRTREGRLGCGQYCFPSDTVTLGWHGPYKVDFSVQLAGHSFEKLGQLGDENGNRTRETINVIKQFVRKSLEKWLIHRIWK